MKAVTRLDAGTPCGRGRTVAFICMPEYGHFQRMRGIIRHFVDAAFRTVVLTHRQYRSEVARAGGDFVDLFQLAPIEAVDSTSIPVPCRYVTYAAEYANLVANWLRRENCSLVVADAFAVVGPIAARELGIPYVTVCAGHNMNPERHRQRLANDPRLNISDSCYHAVEVLRDRYGLRNASAFSYLTTHSPALNLVCEPQQFLPLSERAPFEPVAFFGSLYETSPSADSGKSAMFDSTEANLKVYVAFGTVAWRYFRQQALQAIQTLIEAIGKRVQCVISLGRSSIGPEEIQIPATAAVKVCEFVDQRRVLEEADVFVTHHGLNSTHEAIFHQTPMLSHPFFADQPDMAATCQRFGFAVPLAGAPGESLSASQIHGALVEFGERRSRIKERLREGRRWELQVIRSRDIVVQQIAELL